MTGIRVRRRRPSRRRHPSRRARVDADRRPCPVQPGAAERADQGPDPGRGHQPCRARRRLRRVSRRPLELPDHGRPVHGLPREVGAEVQVPQRAPRRSGRGAVVPHMPRLPHGAPRIRRRAHCAGRADLPPRPDPLLSARSQRTASGSKVACAGCHPKGVAHFDQATCADCHAALDAAFVTRHEASFGTSCLPCHDGTDRFGADFDHNKLPFKLTGKHAGLACARCHADAGSIQALQKAPQDCYPCHAKNDNHKGAFGQQCGQCHTPAGWAGATFDHTIFPVDHGSEGNGHLPDVPPERREHLHLLRMPRAHSGQCPVPTRRAHDGRSGELRPLPRGWPLRGRRLVLRPAGDAAAVLDDLDVLDRDEPVPDHRAEHLGQRGDP